MRFLSLTTSCSIMFVFSAAALAQTPAEIFEEMDSRKRARISTVNNFSVMKTTMGLCTLEHFEKESTESEDGRGSVKYMRLIPISEIAERRSAPDNPMANASAEELEAAADRLEMEAPVVDQAMESEMRKVGMPAGLSQMLTNVPDDKPWLSPMPGDMFRNYATMLDAAAEGKKKAAEQDAKAEEEAQIDQLAAAADRTRVVGTETIGDRPAIHLVAEDLNHSQITNGQEFMMNSLHLWVDAENYVSLKMRIEGSVTLATEPDPRPMLIEREDMGYRAVDGCGPMYEPLRTVMKISGVLSPAEQAQMAEAQVKMAEFETQMASLPASQRDMIMRQLGPQMEMFEKMAAGGGIEVVSLVTGMRCNAGLPTKEEIAQTIPGVSLGACIGFVE